jgi:hypothetical protein
MSLRKPFAPLFCGVVILALSGLGQSVLADVHEGDLSTQKIANGGGGPIGVKVVDEFHITHIDGLKGAPKLIAISVFNVAFRDAKAQSATTKRTSSWGSLSALGTAMRTTATETKSATQSTSLSGVDQATRQRITDAAYKDFVAQLTAAGYQVISPEDLAARAPEYAAWTPRPNFSEGRFGTYVAPTGRKLYFLRNDAAKGDSQGNLNGLAASFQGFDSPEAFQRSPYVAHDAKVGVLAVTLVVDYGVYLNTGDTKKFNAKMVVGFNPGVTAQAGSFYDTATMMDYWGLNSGGFPAIITLAAPLTSDLPFGAVDDGGNGVVQVKADAAQFETAAREVTGVANAKLVAVFAKTAQ